MDDGKLPIAFKLGDLKSKNKSQKLNEFSKYEI